MYFPQFLVGMLVTSFVVAIWIGVETGSGWVALGGALLTLVVLQVGYVLLTHSLGPQPDTENGSGGLGFGEPGATAPRRRGLALGERSTRVVGPHAVPLTLLAPLFDW